MNAHRRGTDSDTHIATMTQDLAKMEHDNDVLRCVQRDLAMDKANLQNEMAVLKREIDHLQKMLDLEQGQRAKLVIELAHYKNITRKRK